MKYWAITSLPGPREVQRERRHVAAEVVDVEDEVLRQRLLVAPDRPADAGVDEPVLVAGGVDRLHPLEPEVPLQLGLDERRDEAARGAVDVHGHVQARVALELVERGGDLADRLVAAVERRAEDRDDADRVLVAVRDRLRRRRGGSARPPSARAAARRPSSGRTSPSTPGRWRPSRGSGGRSACRPPASARASATSAPGRRASPPRSSRSSSSRSRPRARASSTGRRACSRSATRSRPSAGTRPCRSCSCRRSRPSACRPATASRWSRTWRGSAAPDRRAAARWRSPRTQPRARSRCRAGGRSAFASAKCMMSAGRPLGGECGRVPCRVSAIGLLLDRVEAVEQRIIAQQRDTRTSIGG